MEKQLKSTKGIKPGDTVTYTPHCPNPISKIGVVKSIADETHLFVVYHCNGDWKEYQNYTAQNTDIKYLTMTWE